MSQEMPKPKDIINTIYHAAVLLRLTVGYSVIGRKCIKFDIRDPSRYHETIFKLIIPVSLSVVTRYWLATRGFLLNYVISNISKIIIHNYIAILGASIISVKQYNRRSNLRSI